MQDQIEFQRKKIEDIEVEMKSLKENNDKLFSENQAKYKELYEIRKSQISFLSECSQLQEKLSQANIDKELLQKKA